MVMMDSQHSIKVKFHFFFQMSPIGVDRYIMQFVMCFAVSSESLPYFKPELISAIQPVHQKILSGQDNLNRTEDKKYSFEPDFKQDEDELEGFLQQLQQTSSTEKLELSRGKQAKSKLFNFGLLKIEESQFPTPGDDYMYSEQLFKTVGKRDWSLPSVDSALQKLRIVDGSLQTLRNMLKSQSNQRDHLSTVSRRRSSLAQLDRLGKK